MCARREVPGWRWDGVTGKQNLKTLHAFLGGLDFILKIMENNWGILRKSIVETS